MKTEGLLKVAFVSACVIGSVLACGFLIRSIWNGALALLGVGM